MTEHEYGLMKKKNVLYRGRRQDEEGIIYVNVEAYLKESVRGDMSLVCVN